VSLLAAPLGRAAGQGQVIQKCEIRPGHQLVNSGALYLKSATDTKFEDQRQKDLKDAYRVLTQAVTTGGQEKNPAAWYYLARYYEFQKDLGGADSTFAKAQELAPKCKDEIAGRLDDAVAAYKEYLAAHPNDVQAMAGLAGAYSRQDKKDEAMTMFAQVVEHADSAGASDLFATAQTILSVIPQAPDTAPVVGQ